MTGNFEYRLNCAVKAGWITFLIAVALFLVQWIMYVVCIPVQPDWLLRMWGPQASWPEIRTVWFGFMAFFKLFLLLTAFILIWLSLWARMLRNKQAPGEKISRG